MKKNNILYKPFGEDAILIEWPSKIDVEILEEILLFQVAIEEELSDAIMETQNTYHSLLVFFKTKIQSFDVVVDALKKIKNENAAKSANTCVWEIPVCYDLEFGIDLKEIAQVKGLSMDETIKLHSSPVYTVYFIRFLPGSL